MRRFTVITLFVAVLCGLLLVMSLVMSLTWRPLKRQIIYPALPPTPAPTTILTTTTTTTILVTTTLAPTEAPTTAAPTFAPLTITCPPDINITLGSSLELSATGYPVASGGDIPACGAPVAFFSDEPAGIVARSPSFSDSNLVPGVLNTIAITDLNNASYVSSALDLDEITILSATNFNSDYQFLAPTVGTPFVLNGTEGSVYYDGSANRFLILENTPSGVILHLNNSLVSSGWDTILFVNISGQNPQLGVWPRAYVITVAAPSNNMCVVDRLAILDGDLDPLYFCDTSVLGSLAGFSTTKQSWTPLGATFVDGVLPEIESAGTNSIGAVFMRHHDDELHNGASTPLFDWLDIEQWTNINFTTKDYISLRYTVSVNDFDSTPFEVSTPNVGVTVDARVENIMPRLLFQPIHNKTAVVFTTKANLAGTIASVRWVELKWQTPTNLLAARFILSQENKTSTTDGLSRWLPTAVVDAYGNTVIGYNLCDNSTVWPSMYATSRLMNDIPTGLRQEVLVYQGTAPVVPTNGEWGPWATLSSVVPREYLYSGQVSQGLHIVRKIRMTGNIIERTFTGANNCNQTTCVQIIVES